MCPYPGYQSQTKSISISKSKSKPKSTDDLEFGLLASTGWAHLMDRLPLSLASLDEGQVVLSPPPTACTKPSRRSEGTSPHDVGVKLPL